MTEEINAGPPDIVKFLRRRDYQRIRELGEGACGQTVLLFDDQIGEHFVCKKYRPYREEMRPELYEGFRKEIKILHKIHHINIVRVFNYYLYPDLFSGYLLMEYIEGSDIDDYVADHPEDINEVFLQTLNGFAYLEKAGILHRDIRPANLMVTGEGLVKIIDFGFGKQIASPADFDKSISLNWWCEPPEEFAELRYDFKTEIYFIGKLFEELIHDNTITHFDHHDLLRQMCARNPRFRAESFSHLLQDIRTDRFETIGFTAAQQSYYRNFADNIEHHIRRIEKGSKYYSDAHKISRHLRDAYRKFMLEELVPDAALVINCFITGSYYYRRTGFPVSAVADFLGLLRECDPEMLRVLLANLHTRLDTLPRYSLDSRNSSDDDDIPF